MAIVHKMENIVCTEVYIYYIIYVFGILLVNSVL